MRYAGKPHMHKVAQQRGAFRALRQKRVVLSCESVLPTTPRPRVVRSLRATTWSTMSKFRVQVTPPGSYDGNGDFDDWFRRLLPYFDGSACTPSCTLDNQLPELQWWISTCGHCTTRGGDRPQQEGGLPLLRAVQRTGADDQGPGLHCDEDYAGRRRIRGLTTNARSTWAG